MNQNKTARRSIALTIAMLCAVAASPHACACPFCNAAMQTLSQEIESADVALIAQLVEPMPTSTDGVPAEAAAAKFRIVEVLRGGDRLEGAKEINVVYFGDDDPQRRFLITGLAGVTGPGLDWTTPVPLSPRAVDYIRQLPGLPVDGADRLAFFQEFLEDEDPLLAQDAYDEFARTPYDQVIDLGPRMNRQRILDWIQDAGVGPSGRRLYLTMLSICGKPEDVGMLEELLNFDYATMEPGIAATVGVTCARFPSIGMGLVDEMLHSEERRKRESLDALIACYLKLKGAEGADLVNKLFFANPKVEYKHLHSAITAMRFLGEQTTVLPRERLLESMRLALDHHDFADQVIPDLTRWEDWEVMPRLVEMYRVSAARDWVRLPVATYLLIAADVPGEVGAQAQSAISELEGVDADTFRDARSNPALGFLTRAAASGPGANAARPAENSKVNAANTQAAADPLVPGAPEIEDDAAPPKPSGSTGSNEKAPGSPEKSQSDGETDQIAASRIVGSASAAPPLAAPPIAPPSKIKMIGIPLLVAGVLLAVFAVLLRGADPRSSDETP